MNRREFVMAPAVATVTQVSSPKPIGAAFFGISHSHARDKIKLIRSSPAFRLMGIWDEEESQRSRAAQSGLRVVSPEEILRDPEVEVVLVESDVQDHQRHARLALEAGRHVHLEKPPATDVASFRELLNLAERKKLVFQQGYMWRHHPGFQAIRDQVKSGSIGDVYLVTAVMDKTLEPKRRPEWARFRGGQMFEQCSHLIDQLVRLMGRPDRITPFLKKSGKFDDTLADNTVAVFEFPGAMGLVVGSALNPDGNKRRSFTVNGTRGSLVLDSIEPGQLWLESPGKPRQKIEAPPYIRFEDDFRELAAAIRDGRPLSVSANEDLAVQEAVIEASGMWG